MGATATIRTIDELGRIVIPKDVRNTLHIKGNDSIEIFVDEGDKIVLQKYEPSVTRHLDNFYREVEEYRLVSDLDKLKQIRAIIEELKQLSKKEEGEVESNG